MNELAILRTAILELAEFGRVTDETHTALVESVNDHAIEHRFAAIEDRLPKPTAKKESKS